MQSTGWLIGEGATLEERGAELEKAQGEVTIDRFLLNILKADRIGNVDKAGVIDKVWCGNGDVAGDL